MSSLSPSQRPLHESLEGKKIKVGEPPFPTFANCIHEKQNVGSARRVTASPFFDSRNDHTPGQTKFFRIKTLARPSGRRINNSVFTTRPVQGLFACEEPTPISNPLLTLNIYF